MPWSYRPHESRRSSVGAPVTGGCVAQAPPVLRPDWSPRMLYPPGGKLDRGSPCVSRPEDASHVSDALSFIFILSQRSITRRF